MHAAIGGIGRQAFIQRFIHAAIGRQRFIHAAVGRYACKGLYMRNRWIHAARQRFIHAGQMRQLYMRQ